MSTYHPSNSRFPAVAGRFYPADALVLEKEIKRLMSLAVPFQEKNVRAIIAPHSGLIFSGKIAASAYNQISEKADIERVIVLSSSHDDSFEGAAVWCDGDFVMPGGIVETDKLFGRQLVQQHPQLFSDVHAPHLREHGIELQLPFLQHKLKKPWKLVPIVLGTHQPETCRKIAAALQGELREGTLIVVSTDFSHYLKAADARRLDAETEAAILSNNPSELLKVLDNHRKTNIAGYSTSLCGWTSVLTLMYMSVGESGLQFQPVDHCNSGDIRYYGNPDEVVGYRAVMLHL